MVRQSHRPARLDPEAAEQIEGSTDTAVASELAHRAAQALIGGFPGTETEDDPITRSGIVAAVATNGIDDIAELWADSPATTLPGTLWRLFLVREWIRRDPELVARRYATVVEAAGKDPPGGGDPGGHHPLGAGRGYPTSFNLRGTVTDKTIVPNSRIIMALLLTPAFVWRNGRDQAPIRQTVIMMMGAAKILLTIIPVPAIVVTTIRR